ncbi:MAG: hypothetical protein HZC28_18775 [Spirochaetes bacterium]|nr:hypothetical protein [Spirochaetota bacterium]
MIISLLAVLFGTTLLYIAVVSRIEAYIKMTALQGLCLFLIAITGIILEGHFRSLGTIVIAVETLGLKAIIIPWYMTKVTRENDVLREGAAHASHLSSLIAVAVILAVGILLPFSVKDLGVIPPLFFGISLAAVATGFFLIITRKNLMTHVAGYMVIENGIFLLSLGVAKEMPIMVSLGVSLDIFLGVFLAGMFIRRIQGTFNRQHIDTLTDLKD